MNFEEWIRCCMYRLGTGKIKVEESGLEYDGKGYRFVYCHENSDCPLIKGQFQSNAIHPIYQRFQIVPLIVGIKSIKENEIYIKDNYQEGEMKIRLKANEDTFFPFFLSTGYENYHKIKYRFKEFGLVQWIGIEFLEKTYMDMWREYMKDLIYIRLKEYSYFGMKEGVLILNDTLRIEKERIEILAMKERKKIRRWDIDMNYIYLVGKYRKNDIKKELEELFSSNKNT